MKKNVQSLALVEARSASVSGGIKLWDAMTQCFNQVTSRIWQAIDSQIPVGYEDENGFHHGDAHDQPKLD